MPKASPVGRGNNAKRHHNMYTGVSRRAMTGRHVFFFSFTSLQKSPQNMLLIATTMTSVPTLITT
jgi:hypothetical protein